MVSTLLTPTSFCFLVWRRPETGDRCKMGNGSRVTAACLSPPFRISQTAYCYTYRLLSAGATHLCRATLLRVVIDSSYGLRLSIIFTAGCGKVNCPKGKRKCPGVRPRRTVCSPSAHCITATSILHSPFSILNLAKENPLESGFSRYLFTYS